MSAKETLGYIGGSIKSTVYTIGIWTVSLAPILLMVLIVIMGFFQVIGIDIIGALGLPRRAEPYLRISAVSIALTLIPALIVAAKIYQTDKVKFRAVDSKTGKTGVWKIPEERWESLTVEDYRGNEVGKDGLHKVPWYKGSGWEADEYDPENNVAKTSYYAGLSPEELRTRKRAVEDIRTTFLDAYDAALDTTAQRSRQAMQDAGQVTNRNIKDYEQATMPDGELPNTPVQDHIEAQQDDDEAESDGHEMYEQSGDVDTEGAAETEGSPTGGDDE